MAIAITLACKRQEEKTPQPAKTPEAELWLGGDVNLGDGGKGQLQAISGMVQGAPGVVNLEGPVAQGSPSAKFRLWNAPSALAELSAINVRVAGIANNHAGDFGAQGPQKSVKTLREKDILPAGGVAGPALLKINGILIALTAHDPTPRVPPTLAADFIPP